MKHSRWLITFMAFLGGFLVDRFGSKIIWSITAIIWSIATLLMGFSTGLIMIFILRVLCGAAEGPTPIYYEISYPVVAI